MKWGSVTNLHRSNPEPFMSVLGQKQTLRLVQTMSALSPKADIRQHECDVRFGSKADIASFRVERENRVVAAADHRNAARPQLVSV
jgi:hypothetical protein